MCASISDIVDRIGDEEEALGFPDPPEELQAGTRNWKSLLAYFGPGAILASATLASGELLFAPRGGAIFGYTILWALVWAGLVKGIMLYAGIRYYTLTGEHVMSRWAKMPGPRGWFTLFMGFLGIVSFPAWAAGLAKFVGQIVAWIFGLPETNTTFAAVGTIVLAVTAGLILLGGYDYVERIQVGIIAFLAAAIAVLAIAVTPSLTQLIAGLIPTIPGQYPEFVQQNYPSITDRPVWVEVVTYMGAIGGGVYDYIGYVGYAKNREWGMLNRSDTDVQRIMEKLDPGEVVPLGDDEETQRRGRAWLKAPQMDVLMSFGSITFFTATAMLLGAVILHPAELVPSGVDLFRYQARFFTRIHPSLKILWQVGVFFGIFGALYGLWEGYTWTWLESFKPFSERLHRLEQNNMTIVRAITIIYVGGVALVLLWSDLSAVAIVTPVSLLSGVFACGLWCWAMIWVEKTALPDVWQGGWKLDLGLIVAGAFLTGSGLISILVYLGIFSF
jgi:Mn2+/Fe2+ NRAMP family transporter